MELFIDQLGVLKKASGEKKEKRGGNSLKEKRNWLYGVVVWRTKPAAGGLACDALFLFSTGAGAGAHKFRRLR